MFRRCFYAGILIVAAGLAGLGLWVVSRLHHGVEAEAGHRAATLLESTLSQYADDFADGALSADLQARLDRHFQRVSQAIGILDMIIWDPNGKVIHAVRPDITGRVFPPTPHFRKAVSGGVGIAFEDEFHTDMSADPESRGKFFEIYVPIRAAPDGPIVAVAEYYQDAAAAAGMLTHIRGQVWGGIFALGVVTLAILYLVLRQGDIALLRQRMELNRRLAEARRVQEQQESRLRQLNADIHDGIGQLLTVALLRFRPARTRDPARDDPGDSDDQAVRMILEEAMTEVQALLSGSRPGQQDLPLDQAIRAVVNDHVRRTGTLVDLQLDSGVPEPSLPVRIAICRLVREGLHNAFKHAGGKDQRVTMRAAGGRLEVMVLDGGQGPAASPDPAARRPLGLDHLRHRIERLGGTLALHPREGGGMQLCVSFPLVQEVLDA